MAKIKADTLFNDVTTALNQAIEHFKGKPVRGVWTRKVTVVPVSRFKAIELNGNLMKTSYK
jgi:hypothetical protein